MTQQASISKAPGVLSWRLRDTPVVVFAVETTGFPAGRHRVCELSLCRIEPGRAPELVFDSMIDPGRPLTGAEIHGLAERDLEGAPRFEEAASEVVERLSGAVVAAYNIAFSLPFLEEELGRVGVRVAPPHLSLMFLRPAPGLGGRCSLEIACAEARVACEPIGCARAAAQASADLLPVYSLVRRMRELLHLPEERMRAVHARAFLGALATFAGDDWVAAEEAEKLRSLVRSLARLGWSPGE